MSKSADRQLQIVLVFTVGMKENMELVLQPLPALADAIQNTVECMFDDDAGDGQDLDVNNLSHLILRRLEDGDEKETIARNYEVEYVAEVTE